GLHEKLLRVVGIEIDFAETPADKLLQIAKASDVAEGPLGDLSRALSYAARGLREAVAEPDLPAWIERAERLAAATSKQGDLVALLRSAVGDIVDSDIAFAVTLRIAEIARSSLSDLTLSKEYYTRALDLRGDDRRALVALESLHEETAEWPALLDVIRRRIDVADSDAERKQLLFKQARLCEDKLVDLPAAITVYEQILDSGLEREALEAVERLYARADRWPDMIALYERQVGAEGVSNERKAALHHALGSVQEKHLGNVDRAFDEYGAALELDPKNPQSVASLEVLMAQPEHAARAAAMLEPVYLARLDWRRVMATLDARLAVSQDPDERRQVLRRLSKLHEEQAEDYRAALETTALLLGEDVTDESTWAELERLARVANAGERLAEVFAAALERAETDQPETARLARRTGELFESQKNVDRALAFYGRAYHFDPEANDGSFEAIDRLLRQAGKSAERVRLYRESLDRRASQEERLGALHTIAAIEETELRDDAAAAETYRAALEVDEGDLHSLEALSRLYARGERWRDLAGLTRRRAEQSALPEDEAGFRMVLAKLLIEKLGEAGAGVDELQSVVDLTAARGPGPGAEALVALESLVAVPEHKARIVDILRPIYERADDWRHLVAINDDRLSLATDASDKAAVLRESAALWEQRGGDLARAYE
ncbi:MAG: tetratricopeptide repeat protein, partial [Polyangiaceae bacterium]